MATVKLQHLLARYVMESCQELLGEYAVSVEPTLLDERGCCADCVVAGAIGFGGDGIKGSLVLASTFPVVRATVPAQVSPAREPDQAVLADWIGELSNQLLGRVKNRLLLHGVALVMSTPVSLIGERIAHSGQSAERHQQAAFAAPQGIVRTCLEVALEREVLIEEQPCPRESAGVAGEGDVLLF